MNGHAHAGYDYNDSLILGFSHVRVEGMGCRGENAWIARSVYLAGGVESPVVGFNWTVNMKRTWAEKV